MLTQVRFRHLHRNYELQCETNMCYLMLSFPEDMEEYLMPRSGNGDKYSVPSSKSRMGARDEKVQGKLLMIVEQKRCSQVVPGLRELQEKCSRQLTMEMEVRLKCMLFGEVMLVI